MRRSRPAFLLPLLLGPVGCNGLSQVCDTGIQPSVVVTIQDSVTGLPAASGAFGRVIDGTFEDTLTPFSSVAPDTLINLAMRGERVGTYVVEIRQNGYLIWQRSGVQVHGASCHTTQARLVAKLVAGP